MAGRLLGLNYVGVIVRDLEASTAWYAEHLGFERMHEYGFLGVRALFIRRGDLRLEVFQVEGSAPMVTERTVPEANLRSVGSIISRLRWRTLMRWWLSSKVRGSRWSRHLRRSQEADVSYLPLFMIMNGCWLS